MNESTGETDGPATAETVAPDGGRGGVESRESRNLHYANDPQKFSAKGAIPEADLAGQLGVSRDSLRACRDHRNRGEHWEKEGRTVVWLPAGVAMLRTTFQLQDSAAEKGGQVEPLERAREEGLVVEVVPRNRRLVMARTQGGDLVRVRVRDNRNFLRGMMLRECRHEQADVWVHSGRCPRWRGRY